MKKKKTGFAGFLDQLNNPPGWVLLLLYATAIISLPLSVYAMINGYDSGYAITAYVAVFLLFAYTVYLTVRLLMKAHRKVGTVADRYAFTRRLYRNFEFRTVIFSVFPLIGNLAYAAFLCYIAWKTSAHWYLMVALYYILLMTARGGVLFETGKIEWRFKHDPIRLRKEKLRSYFYCGIMMLVLTVALSVALVQMVSSGKRMSLPWVSVYAAGIVTLYRVITSTANFVRSKRYDDFVAKAVQYINVAAALVSILSFQTLWFDVYPPDFSASTVNAVTGIIVCLAVLLLGVHMIIRAAREQRKINADEQRVRQYSDGYNRAEYQEEYGQNSSSFENTNGET